jgi:putative tryptophan/tyrosine transport system substrate-binding protein
VTRRQFITLIGGAAATWPLGALAQQPAMALVGLLTGNQLDDRWLSAVGEGLKEVGYIEGRNAAIKYRSAGGRFDRLPALAAELVADPVAVIVTLTPAAALAAKAATTTIPIVFATGADPVDLGLVSSLNHPGGNVTGISFLVNTLESKRLELVRDLLPSATAVGFSLIRRTPLLNRRPEMRRWRRAPWASSSWCSMRKTKAKSMPPLRALSNSELTP